MGGRTLPRYVPTRRARYKASNPVQSSAHTLTTTRSPVGLAAVFAGDTELAGRSVASSAQRAPRLRSARCATTGRARRRLGRSTREVGPRSRRARSSDQRRRDIEDARRHLRENGKRLVAPRVVREGAVPARTLDAGPPRREREKAFRPMRPRDSARSRRGQRLWSCPSFAQPGAATAGTLTGVAPLSTAHAVGAALAGGARASARAAVASIAPRVGAVAKEQARVEAARVARRTSAVARTHATDQPCLAGVSAAAAIARV